MQNIDYADAKLKTLFMDEGSVVADEYPPEVRSDFKDAVRLLKYANSMETVLASAHFKCTYVRGTEGTYTIQLAMQWVLTIKVNQRQGVNFVTIGTLSKRHT